MKAVLRILSAFLCIPVSPLFCIEPIANVPPAAILRDRELAKLAEPKDSIAANAALARLEEAKDYEGLCELLVNSTGQTEGLGRNELLNSPDDTHIASVALFNYLLRTNQNVIENDNGEKRGGQVMTAKLVIGRLSRILGVSSAEVEFYNTASVQKFTDKIYPLMLALQANTPGAPKIEGSTHSADAPSPGIEPHVKIAQTEKHQTSTPSNHTISGRLLSTAWLVVGFSAAGLLWLLFRPKRGPK